MFPERMCNLEDIALMGRHRVVLPGAPEPEWLRRAAAHAQALRQLRADRRVARPEALPAIARRLRLVFARRSA